MKEMEEEKYVFAEWRISIYGKNFIKNDGKNLKKN